MTHIAINAQLLSPEAGYRQAGVSGYIQRLLRRMLGAAIQDEWTVYAPPGVDRRLMRAGRTTTLRTAPLPTRHPAVRIFYEQTLLPLALIRDWPDVLLCPLNVMPLMAARPTVVTVHDLAFLRFPHLFPPAKQRYLAALTRQSMRRAKRIITVSEFTRREVLELFGVDPGVVQTIPNGRDEGFERPPAAEIARFRQRHGLPEHFVLFVGTLEPRKNLVALIRAYDRVRREIAMPLILVGGKGWLYEPVLQTIETLGLRDDVRLAGFAASEELACWYGAATMFVYPSLYEGFGFPPLEAMQCGVPVVTSNRASLPEVVGDAAVLVDPDDVDALANALLQVARDANLRDELRHRGLEQAQCFSWGVTAEATHRLLIDVAEARTVRR
ncbi:MAG: glycosyltransferase family 1 protein [Herpetosiphon sp.]